MHTNVCCVGFSGQLHVLVCLFVSKCCSVCFHCSMSKSPLASTNFIYVTSSFTFDLYRPPHHRFLLSLISIFLHETLWPFALSFPAGRFNPNSWGTGRKGMDGAGESEREGKKLKNILKESERKEETKQRWCRPHGYVLWLWQTLQLAGQQIGGCEGDDEAWDDAKRKGKKQNTREREGVCVLSIAGSGPERREAADWVEKTAWLPLGRHRPNTLPKRGERIEDICKDRRRREERRKGQKEWWSEELR